MIYYVGSKLKHRELWAASGLNIISSWIKEGIRMADPDELDRMWDTYRKEMDEAQGFVMYIEPGDIPKGALIELGMAFMRHLPIFIVWEGTMRDLEDIMGTVIYHTTVKIVPELAHLPRD